MPVKILMTWNILPNREAEYSEFVVNEFIPRLNRLGLADLEFWYTRFGERPQIQASGVCPSVDQLNLIMNSEEWDSLQDLLSGYVSEYQHKMVKASRGFQF
ncbi:MAG: hypothetical protein QNJ45_24940 [Ardenticatenaceae bacterium]|nr:hypothetical protein [Ardenticatenaceae bacterium]